MEDDIRKDTSKPGFEKYTLDEAYAQFCSYDKVLMIERYNGASASRYLQWLKSRIAFLDMDESEESSDKESDGYDDDEFDDSNELDELNESDAIYEGYEG